MKLMLLILILFIAGCTAEIPQNIILDNTTINNVTENITQSQSITIENTIIQNFTTQNETNTTIQNVTENKKEESHPTPKPLEVSVPEKPPVTNLVTDYQGNPLDLFKSNSIIIFGNSGSLVAATVNLQPYTGATYMQDDGGQMPDKNVILLGNCTNSYIAQLTDCKDLDGVHLKLIKNDNYILIVLANDPAAIYDAINIMIKPNFKMREKI